MSKDQQRIIKLATRPIATGPNQGISTFKDLFSSIISFALLLASAFFLMHFFLLYDLHDRSFRDSIKVLVAVSRNYYNWTIMFKGVCPAWAPLLLSNQLILCLLAVLRHKTISYFRSSNSLRLGEL